jgi:diguanylate cyclase (GGDEF)-like protein
LLSVSRSTDFVARYGGEEFCVVLNSALVESVFGIADRFRKAIEQIEIKVGDTLVHVTASFGVSASEHFPMTPSRELISHADKALYQAKDQGRNCVVLSTSEDMAALSE